MVQAYSIPKATRPPNPSEIYHSPGPGDYKGEQKMQKEEPPKWTIGSNDLPASRLVLTHSSILVGKIRDTSLEKLKGLPGPGSYKLHESYDATLKNLKAINFGSSSRPGTTDISRNALPGPGSYDHNLNKIRQNGPQFKFGFSTREKDPHSHLGSPSRISPGPGSYSTP